MLCVETPKKYQNRNGYSRSTHSHVKKKREIKIKQNHILKVKKIACKTLVTVHHLLYVYNIVWQLQKKRKNACGFLRVYAWLCFIWYLLFKYIYISLQNWTSAPIDSKNNFIVLKMENVKISSTPYNLLVGMDQLSKLTFDE